MFRVMPISKCYSLQSQTLIDGKTIPELVDQYLLVHLRQNECRIQSNQSVWRVDDDV